MAKITKIKASYGTTVNMGDFNNIRLDLEMEVELEEGDDKEAVKKALQNEVMNEVNMRAKGIKQAYTKAQQGK